MKNNTLRLRKLLTLIITCCLIVTTVVPMTAAAEDISGHWAIDDISFLQEKGLVRGDNNGNISPDNNITRAELIALINRTFKFIEVGEVNFPDVEPGTWYYDDLAIAKNQGYIQGDNYGNANPGNPITRAEVAVALARVLELEPQSDTSEFDDSASFPSWSVDGIIAMTESGIVGGYPDNTFRASNSITRAEAMTIMARIIRLIESEEEEVGDEETPLDPLSGSNISGGGPGGGNPGSGNPGSGPGGALTITSFAGVNVYTSVETAPTMPAEITAYYSDGLSASVFVTWDSIDLSQYSYVGTFSVQGTVTGTSIRPSATVTVLSNTPVTFLDPNFKEAVIDNLKLLPAYSDYTKYSVLYPVDLVTISSLDVSKRGITSMGELSYFTNLERLYCTDNQLTTLDVSGNTQLDLLDCDYNNLSTLDVSKNTALLELYCGGNNLAELDVSNDTALLWFNCGNNNLTALDVSNNAELHDLRCGANNLETLDVSNNTALEFLYCGWNNLAELDVSINTELQQLGCEWNSLTSLDISKNTALEYLNCWNNNLSTLNVNNNTALNVLDCSSNNLSILDISNNLELQTLRCYYNDLTTLDVGNKMALEYLDCEFNNLTVLDVSKNAVLQDLRCAYNDLTVLDVSNNTVLQDLSCGDNTLTELDISNNTELKVLDCGWNNITTLDVSNNTALQYLGCGDNILTTLDVSNNTELVSLDCGYLYLSTLNVSNNTQLQYLHCWNDDLTELDVSNNPVLFELYCGNNNLTELDVSNNTLLKHLAYGGNSLNAVDVSANTALEYLDCGWSSNPNTLDVSNNTALKRLICWNSNLSALDVSNNPELRVLDCRGTKLTTLDVSNNTALENLYCGGTQLESVYFTRGSNMCSVVANGNGYLSELSIDFLDGQIQVEVSGENDPYWELSGAMIAKGIAMLNLSLTSSGMAYSGLNGTILSANFLTPPTLQENLDFVYIVGSWMLSVDGYTVDVIVEGKPDTITVKNASVKDWLVAKEGQIWNNIKTTSSGVLDISSATQLFYDASSLSAVSTIKNNGGLLELDGVNSGYAVDDNAPVYIITKTGEHEVDLDVSIAKDLDEDDFLFAYLDADADQVVSNIYIIKVDL